MQDGPRETRVLRSNGDNCAPLAAAFHQAARPATEAVLFVADAVEDGTGAENKQASRIGITSFGDVAQSGFTAATVLAGGQAYPGGSFATTMGWRSPFHSLCD